MVVCDVIVSICWNYCVLAAVAAAVGACCIARRRGDGSAAQLTVRYQRTQRHWRRRTYILLMARR